MKGIILSAGHGTRLRPLTYFLPKQMIKVGGKPILEHIVNYLHTYGVFDIVINLHHFPFKIMKHFGTSVLYSYEPQLLGEEGTIASLERWRDKDYCVVVNGDTLTNLNLSDMFKMADGDNVKFMDGETYAGVRIIKPSYKDGDVSVKFQTKDAWWIDTGTRDGLKKAKELYEKKSN